MSPNSLIVIQKAWNGYVENGVLDIQRIWEKRKNHFRYPVNLRSITSLLIHDLIRRAMTAIEQETVIGIPVLIDEADPCVGDTQIAQDDLSE